MGDSNIESKSSLDRLGSQAAILRSYDPSHKTASESDQGGESSGNNASNGTTQRLSKNEQALAEASTAAKPQGDDIHELSRKGYCAHPLARVGKPAQAGTGVVDVDQLQTSWCRYAGQEVEKGAVWRALKSPAVQRRLMQQQQSSIQDPSTWLPYSTGKAPGRSQPWFTKPDPDLSQDGLYTASQDQKPHISMHHKSSSTISRPSQSSQILQDHKPTKPVSSAQPPTNKLPALPASPFSSVPADRQPVQDSRDEKDASGVDLSDTSPYTASNQSKFLWIDSPRHSYSDGEAAAQQLREQRQTSFMRQVSLPDINELADIWGELSSDVTFDLDNLQKDAPPGLQPNLLQSNLSLRQSSLAKFERASEAQIPLRMLQDIKSQRRNRSMRISSALTWQPGAADDDMQALRASLSLAGMPLTAFDDSLKVHSAPDRSSISGFNNANTSALIQGMDLPEQMQLSLVGAPSIFSVPTCINKSFKPPFAVRVAITSTHPMRLSTSVTAYTLQKEQLSKLETWHPSQHVFTESLSGAFETATIACEKESDSSKGGPKTFVGSADIFFSNLKFNTSSRMKPRWLLFALTLPTDDVIFVQYTVPTIVMSRQCDQTPRALAILRGEMPTRKRARQCDTPEVSRSKASPFQASASEFFSPAAMPVRPPGLFQDPQSMHAPDYFLEAALWPQQGPYIMSTWRQAIQKICRAFGLTRSFEQEDMHELAKMAGFVRPAAQGVSVLSEYQWARFGKWFTGILSVLKMHKHLWMSMDVMYISGFSATRECTDQLLSTQPEGTFLIRPSMAMEATLVISVVTRTRVVHLAINYRQLLDRSLEDWVMDLPDTQALLDTNTGMRYPKSQLFQHRSPPRMPPMMRDYSDLHLNPVRPPTGAQGMLPGMTPQGQDALAHILEASRRSDSFSSLTYNAAVPKPLGQMLNYDHGCPPDMTIDQWGYINAREQFQGPQVDLEQLVRQQNISGHHAMRFQGHQ